LFLVESFEEAILYPAAASLQIIDMVTPKMESGIRSMLYGMACAIVAAIQVTANTKTMEVAELKFVNDGMILPPFFLM
jgi:hypothetical protein